MKKEKIQLTVNSGVSKEVLLQGTSHPLKVIKYLLLLLCKLQHIITAQSSAVVSGKK